MIVLAIYHISSSLSLSCMYDACVDFMKLIYELLS